MATMQHKIFCICEFIKTALATAVQCAFHLHFKIQPPRKSICRWNRQFKQTGCPCKGISSGQPRVSEENVRRIQESFEHSPCKSTCRASSELGILQRTVWHVLWCRLLFNWVHLFESPCIMWKLKILRISSEYNCLQPPLNPTLLQPKQSSTCNTLDETTKSQPAFHGPSGTKLDVLTAWLPWQPCALGQRNNFYNWYRTCSWWVIGSTLKQRWASSILC